MLAGWGNEFVVLPRAQWRNTSACVGRRARPRAPSSLAASLFDEHGEPLTPSHAVKGTRRYRYYVSRNLIQDKADQANRGLRLPAAEIERITIIYRWRLSVRKLG